MTLTLDQLKNWLRINHDFDNDLLNTLMVAAQSQIQKAIFDDGLTHDDIVQSELFNIAVCMLVSSWYEQRNDLTDKTLTEFPNGVTSIIHTLRGDLNVF